MHTIGLTCKSCVHVSHDMDKVPPESVPGIETYLRQMENKDCLSTTMKPEYTGTCDTSQEASTGKAKCTTTQVLLTAKGMDTVAGGNYYIIVGHYCMNILLCAKFKYETVQGTHLLFATGLTFLSDLTLFFNRSF